VTALRVIKIGGRPQQDPALLDALRDAWRAAPGSFVVVHGGGDELSTLQRAFGREPQFIGGRRVTADADIDLVRMTLSGAANKRLVSALAEARAVGLSGEDAGVLSAQRTPDAAMGRVGVPTTSDPALLRLLLAAGHLPVISPVARAIEDGGAYNVNGDDAAAAIAVALGAAELVLVSDVAAVLDHGAPLAALTADDARAMIADGRASGGMVPKLDAALLALARGVARVRIGNLTAIHSRDAGTIVHAAALEGSRQ
jgi:acetylglutamate kinase